MRTNLLFLVRHFSPTLGDLGKDFMIGGIGVLGLHLLADFILEDEVGGGGTLGSIRVPDFLFLACGTTSAFSFTCAVVLLVCTAGTTFTG